MSKRGFAVLAVVTALAAIVAELTRRDSVPMPLLPVALTFLMPGFVIRGLVSKSDLGFQDWRDTALMVLGTGAVLALLLGVLVGVSQRLWRRGRRPQ